MTLNLELDDDVLWMRACIWPGDTERLARFEAGVLAMRAAQARSRPVLERLTASLVPKRLEALVLPMQEGTLLLAYQTLLSGYLDATERTNYRRGMFDLLSHQIDGRTIWVELELDDARRRLPAVLIAHVRAADAVRSLRLGRSSQHPTEIEVDAAGVAELRLHLGCG